MLDSDFWRKLAEEFRAIQNPAAKVGADWDYTVVAGEQPPTVAQWRFIGNRSARLAFEALARRGGPMVYPRMESLTGWLEAIRYYRLYEDRPLVAESRGVGKTIEQVYGGRITDLCQASIDLCNYLDATALENERLALTEQPEASGGHLPPLLRQWEAFKSIRQLLSGPHEEIPEVFVRSALAQKLGIKPEDVTLEQVRLEVATLLPYYPAITVVPWQPASEIASQGSNIIQPVPNQEQSVETRETRLQSFLASKTATVAAVRRAARVAKANMQQWRRGELSSASVMSERIEDVLSGKTPVD